MNIVLTGFMGSGKTTIGKLLSKRIKHELVEMDDLIVKKSKRASINEIFAKDGEDSFRELETEVAKQIQKNDKKIVSTGGGVVMNYMNMAYLKKNSFVIYLKMPFDIIRKMTAKENTRPLFQNNQSALNLYKFRQPIYEYYADHIVNEDGKTNKQIVEQIVNHINNPRTVKKQKSSIKINVVIGDPISHSISPIIHNAAYKALKIDKQFVFLANRVKVKDIKVSIESMRKLGITGMSCTVPHKELVIKYLDKIDKTAKIIGAINTIVNNNGKLKGYNTDYIGVIKPLEKITKIRNKKVALLGAGGAARAAAYAFIKEGANLTIFNRTLAKAQKIAKEIGGKAQILDKIEQISNFDIIFNSTTVGMAPNLNKTLIPAKYLSNNQIIFDAVYSPLNTKLLHDAKKKGAKTINGLEMWLYQALEQFKLYTGINSPEIAMRSALKHITRNT